MIKTSFLLLCSLVFHPSITGLANTGTMLSKNHPLSNSGFIENKGQVYCSDSKAQTKVLFALHQAAFDFFLSANGYSYQFTKNLNQNTSTKPFPETEINYATERMEMQLLGANANPRVTKEGRSSDYTNYPSLGIKETHSFEKIIYHDIYPAIDWVIYRKNGGIKYDFVVKPGGDPTLIKLKYNYIENILIDETGHLRIKGILGEVDEGKLYAEQNSSEIKSSYVLKNNQISFSFSSYDKNDTLIIDPLLVWGTYYGGTGEEYTSGCVADGAGNSYISGYTNSSAGFAAGGYQNNLGGSYDAFLVKFNSAGNRLWATYLGGSAMDLGRACAVDASGNVYLSGNANSTTGIALGGFQNTLGGFTDAFLTKFDGSGNLIWSTYFGGPLNDAGMSCAVSPSGDIIMSGATGSTVDITTSGFQTSYGGGAADMFVVKFSPNGTKLWSTYFGGPGDDQNLHCSIDNTSNIYISGHTSSTVNVAFNGFQTVHGGGSSDGLLVKFDGAGVFQWSTYYGGSSYDQITGTCADLNSNLYIVGNTNSTNNISASGFQNNHGGATDCFVIKLNAQGMRTWGTYFGGTADDYAGTPCSDAAGNLYLSGTAGSTSGISYQGHQNTFGGQAYDAMLVKFSPAGSRLWASYYGGGSLDYGTNCWLDPQRNVYLAGHTISLNNIGNGGFQNSHSAGTNQDAFLVKFCNEPNPPAISGNFALCATGNQSYSVSADPYSTGYIWLLSPGYTMTPVANSATINISQSGTIAVIALNSCGMSPPSIATVVVNSLPIISAAGGSICLGSSFSISPTGASSYSVSGGAFLVTPTLTTTYSISGTSAASCLSAFPALVTVTVFPFPVISVNSGSICPGQSFTIMPSGASTYSYSSPGNVVSPSSTSVYTVSGSSPEGCLSKTSASSTVTLLQVPSVSLAANHALICVGDTALLQANGAQFYTWSNNLAGNSLTVSPVTTSAYQVIGFAANGCTASASVTLQVAALPFVSITTLQDTICEGETTLLIAKGALTYSWSTSATSDSLLVLVAAASANFTVTGTDHNGCKNSSSIQLQVEECTGLSENFLAGFRFYPNPASDKLFFEGEFKGQLLVFDASGKLLQSIVPKDLTFINLDHFSSGLYLLRFINAEGQVKNEKLLISK